MKALNKSSKQVPATRKKILFTLTVDEANLIFKALGDRPFSEVFELIGKLHEQANEQYQRNNAFNPGSQQEQ
ncbi:hypothetical protein KFE98_20015 [bacterium SCSIO 12741]|nr:hypothetical protein KFE98_20015 [bacterium SCSIO 12741]